MLSAFKNLGKHNAAVSSSTSSSSSASTPYSSSDALFRTILPSGSVDHDARSNKKARHSTTAVVTGTKTKTTSKSSNQRNNSSESSSDDFESLFYVDKKKADTEGSSHARKPSSIASNKSSSSSSSSSLSLSTEEISHTPQPISHEKLMELIFLNVDVSTLPVVRFSTNITPTHIEPRLLDFFEREDKNFCVMADPEVQAILDRFGSKLTCAEAHSIRKWTMITKSMDIRWREERRKNFPTAANVSQKKEGEQARRECGEPVDKKRRSELVQAALMEGLDQDFSSPSRAHQEKHDSEMFEKSVESFFQQLGIVFASEKAVYSISKSNGVAPMTPDILFPSDQKVFINGHRVYWAELKNYLGFKSRLIVRKLVPQLSKYHDRYGAGMVIFSLGFTQDLEHCAKECLFVDARSLGLDVK